MPKIGSLAKSVVAAHHDIRDTLASQGLNASAKIRTVRKPNSQDFACIVGTSIVMLFQQSRSQIIFTTAGAVVQKPTYSYLYDIYKKAMFGPTANTLSDLLYDAYGKSVYTKSVYEIVLEYWRKGFSLVGHNQLHALINDGLLEASDVLDAIALVTSNYVERVIGKNTMAVSIHHKKFNGVVYGTSCVNKRSKAAKSKDTKKKEEAKNAKLETLES